MGGFIKYLFLLISITLFGCSEKQGSVRNTAVSENICKPIVAVYPVWKHSKSELQLLPWDDFSHIAVSSIYPLPNGELYSKEADVFIDSLVSIARAKGKINNLYFETQDSVERKYSYIRDNALGGVFMFEVTSDHRSSEHSLLKPANLVLNGNCQAI